PPRSGQWRPALPRRGIPFPGEGWAGRASRPDPGVRFQEGDGAVGGWEPEEEPAFAGGGATAGDGDLGLAGREVAVALAEALPGAGGHGQAQVGRLRPGAEGDEDRPALVGP